MCVCDVSEAVLRQIISHAAGYVQVHSASIQLPTSCIVWAPHQESRQSPGRTWFHGHGLAKPRSRARREARGECSNVCPCRRGIAGHRQLVHEHRALVKVRAWCANHQGRGVNESQRPTKLQQRRLSNREQHHAANRG